MERPIPGPITTEVGKMRLIFSRKGFDSGSGGCPSPIFPDGRMLSLPIPDRNSLTRYEQISWSEFDLGKVVSDLTKGRVRPDHFAHLDPDLDRGSLTRQEGWQPAFGQTGSAQGHLRNCGVQEGDLFLFFGLFRNICFDSGVLEWQLHSTRRHVIWGWLQIGKVIAMDDCDKSEYLWADRHPHFHRPADRNNTLYVGRSKLDLACSNRQYPGSGIFRTFFKELQLTELNSASPGDWRLPAWFYPEGDKPALTYHTDLKRWERLSQFSKLKAVDRGQEFVLDCARYPEAADWICELLSRTL